MLTARIDEPDEVLDKLYKDSALGLILPGRCHALMRKFRSDCLLSRGTALCRYMIQRLYMLTPPLNMQ
ncbi:hypothetical protein SDC9_165570 [bioreactor metagenome]|uniref:Uncharacterized protein n=1 Tax=bioreactor metagenome TaxID=1076179 RepID=A0A645FUN4_9ZZZZ